MFDIALDDATELDIVFKHDNYNIVINKELAKKLILLKFSLKKALAKVVLGF
ncbi:hypothetical protein [Paraclostridium sp. AKS81]|uniref:hypothetical protein n=1 Tax=Paraclostridium sp. AKS81 TaxID=2876117 RepID=UPI0021DFF357|nr:hypothetical protein [Paraclostridium sp. AKS81]MCU9812911.1 hypothetical protein [Paraclostridium sp. AKS81]